MKVVILDSGGSNISSIIFSLERLGIKPVFTSHHSEIRAADKIILPGVGSAQNARQKLEQYNLFSIIKELTKPVLGICIGMQELFNHSDEGDIDLLGIIQGNVKKFDIKLPIPHMGWNKLSIKQANTTLLSDIHDGSWMYFVHSYYVSPIDSSCTIATASYGIEFPAIIQRNNFYGIQFHPEKSADAGSQIFKNFLFKI